MVGPSPDPSESATDGPSAPPQGDATGATVSRAPVGGFFRRHWVITSLVVLFAAPTLVLGAWTAVALNWSYSNGKRTGYVQKISRKGYLCKTWEGTLYTDIARGFRSDSFAFSVRSDSIARTLEALSGKRVAVDYEQHIGVPTTCFGETEYFVTGVQVVPE
jgi:hypothetical protein